MKWRNGLNRVVQVVVVFVAVFAFFTALEAAWDALRCRDGATAAAPPLQLPAIVRLTACFAHYMHTPTFSIVLDTSSDTGGKVAETDGRTDPPSVTFYARFLPTSDSLTRVVAAHELTHLLAWPLYSVAWKADSVAAYEANEELAIAVSSWPVWQERCRS